MPSFILFSKIISDVCGQMYHKCVSIVDFLVH